MNAHILSALNAYISEANVKESFNADWISVKLKEKTVVVLTIKLIFV